MMEFEHLLQMHTQRVDVFFSGCRVAVGLVGGKPKDFAHFHAFAIIKNIVFYFQLTWLRVKIFPDDGGQFEAGSLEDEEKWNPLVVGDPPLLPFFWAYINLIRVYLRAIHSLLQWFALPDPATHSRCPRCNSSFLYSPSMKRKIPLVSCTQWAVHRIVCNWAEWPGQAANWT